MLEMFRDKYITRAYRRHIRSYKACLICLKPTSTTYYYYSKQSSMYTYME